MHTDQNINAVIYPDSCSLGYGGQGSTVCNGSVSHAVFMACSFLFC